MLKDTQIDAAPEVWSSALEMPAETRGSRREQAKRRRRMERVSGKTLVIGLDLAREKQALTFGYDRMIVGRKRMKLAPQHLGAAIAPVARKLCEQHGLERVVVGLEPAAAYWELAAEGFEREGLGYALAHTLAVRREREATSYNHEKHDPRDADVIFAMTSEGKFTETRLPATAARARFDALAREYLLARKRAAAERTRMTNFWTRVLPEFFAVFSEMTGVTALAVSRAMLPFSELVALTSEQWLARVRTHADGRVLRGRVAKVQELVRAAHADPHRRAGEGIPVRIAMAAERHRLISAQKTSLRERLLALYAAMPEAVWLDTIPGSDRLYNALTLALVGDFALYDSPRALVKLAGSEVNWHESGDWKGKSRISHRGRSLLRAVAYQQARHLVHNQNPVYLARMQHLLHRARRPALALNQAYVAIGNSYLRTSFVLVTQKTGWQPPK